MNRLVALVALATAASLSLPACGDEERVEKPADTNIPAAGAPAAAFGKAKIPTGKYPFFTYNGTVPVYPGLEISIEGPNRYRSSGQTGNYSYRRRSGKVKWSSGPLTGIPAKYKVGPTTRTITLQYKDHPLHPGRVTPFYCSRKR
jgi:hypothetical protein